ncbi:hypothetical protein [Leptolyngbya sp. 7M]|uniref:hypothetical protein n=1 Tax=Leptolyngbya sp. 7M TaxID=2812896 RepID=UPI001B8A9A05|nr:hypothetical protein [Leptolyngbya sp. 7M]QYO67675.1 hypothetical protein JVX88_13310 [Leptolyngbya sp. 7M]
MKNMLQPEFLDELFASFQLDEYTAQSLRFTPPGDEIEIISATDYLQPNRLTAMIEAAAKENKVEDLRVAAAVSNKLYHWIVLPGVLIMMTSAGIGLDASAENASFIIKESELKMLWLHNLENTAIYPPRFPFSIPDHYAGKILNSVDELHHWCLQVYFDTTFLS